jgi:hypothetical protein
VNLLTKGRKKKQWKIKNAVEDEEAKEPKEG